MKWAVVTGIIASTGCDVVVHIHELAPADAEVAPPDTMPPCRFSAWSEPVRIAANDPGLSDEEPALSPDGQIVVWQRKYTASDVDLWYAVRTGNDFVSPTDLLVANTDGLETGPFWSPDGTRLYYTQGAEGVVKAILPVDPGPTFRNPVQTDELASLPYVERPRFRTDGLEIVYFAHPTADLFHATRTAPSSNIWTPSELTTASSAAVDHDPTLTTDGLTMYFSSAATNDGSLHLFETTRPSVDAAFDEPGDLGNFGVDQPSGPDISRDGLTMVFSGYPDSQADIYIMTRHCE
jgi:Tol biopolymer transport system component